MVDEFNKPLGQKPEPSSKSPSSRSNASAWVGIAGLVVGLAALGLFGWQTFYVPPEPPVTSAPAEQVAAAEQSGQTKEADAPKDFAANEVKTGSESEAGEGTLTEIEPAGSLVVPTPRPQRAKPQEIGLAHLPDPDLVERGATGVIPKRSADGKRPMDVYAREPDTTGNFGVARVVLIVGGMGISQTSTQLAIRKLPGAVTLGFAPYGNSLTRWMQAARKKGHEILLQIPMEPFGYPSNSPGPHTLVSSFSSDENIANLHWFLSRITNYVGVMSFQGAKLLAEPDALRPIFDELAKRGLLFVDAGTAGNSKSKQVAGLSILANTTAQVQIDARRTRKDIAKQIEFLVAEAKRRGVAIGVSNGFPETIEMLALFAEKAGELGVEITPVSAVVDDPEMDR